MLIGKINFFRKNIFSISNSINRFEKSRGNLLHQNKGYLIPSKYRWKNITNKYLDVFYKLTKSQNS